MIVLFIHFFVRMPQQPFPGLHLQLIGCTGRSAVKWRVCSPTHSCRHLAGIPSDNAVSMQYMLFRLTLVSSNQRTNG